MTDKLWRAFRAWPIWAQILGWLFLFWILVPLLIWRTSWATPWKVVAMLAFLLLVVGIGSDRPTTEVSSASGESTPQDRGDSEPASSPSPEPEDKQGEQEGQADDDNKPNRTETVQRDRFVVARVVDGDTIEARAGIRSLDVRLIGVDTPETVHPSEPVQCFGPQASDFAKNQLGDQRVRLEFDVEKKDRYGRTLAYVWVGNRLFNETLVARGYARVATYPPNVKYVDRLISAQQAARNNHRGLWHACRGDTDQSGGLSNAGSPEDDSGANCDGNYRGACIPAYPPDLNCDEVSASGFRSVGSDPHGFDGDADGIACE